MDSLVIDVVVRRGGSPFKFEIAERNEIDVGYHVSLPARWVRFSPDATMAEFATAVRLCVEHDRPPASKRLLGMMIERPYGDAGTPKS